MNTLNDDRGTRPDLSSAIDQLRKENAELRQILSLYQFNESPFSAFIGSMSDAVLIITTEGLIASINFTASMRFGKPPAELIGKGPEDLFDAAEAKRFRELFERVKSTATEFSQDEFVDNRYIRTKIYPIFNSDGIVSAVGIIAKDVTEIKQYESIYALLLRLFALSGNDFFQMIVTSLSKELNVKYAIIGSFSPAEPDSITTIAMAENGKIIPNITYNLEGAPCKTVVGQSLKVYKKKVRQLFPSDTLLQEISAECYIGAPLYSTSGQPLGLTIIIDDKPIGDTFIHERILELLARKIAVELEVFQKTDVIKKIEKKFSMLFRQAPVSIAVSRHANYIFVNDAYAAMFGYNSASILIGKPLIDNIAPECRHDISLRNRKRENGESVPNEYDTYGLKADSTVFPMHVTVSKIILEDGPATLAFLKDLTSERETANILNQRELWLRESQRVARIGFFNIHMKERYWEATEEIDRIFGLEGAQTKSIETWLNLIHPSHRAEFEEYFWNNVIRLKQPFDREYKIITLSDNVEKWVHSKGKLSFDENGEPLNMTGTVQDISERKAMMHDLLEAKEKAELMNTIKSNFFTNMSHELRTPLIGILGFSELLQEKLQDDSDLNSMAETIHTSGHRLLETLNLILSLSKLDSEKIIPQFKAVDLIVEIKELFSLYVPVAEKKGVQFLLEVLEPELVAIADPQLFRSVLNNLLNNALKFTDSGRVCLQTWKDDSFAIISVADTGSGIAIDKQQLIWQEFRQASEGIGRSFEGTGLGLTIAQRYIHLMHGTIALESEPGMGSTFTVKLPLALTKADEYQTPVKTPVIPDVKLLDAKKILYVDDDPIAIDFVQRCIPKSFNLIPAQTAKAALDIISGNSFDAILMDINLGKDLDGVQLTAIIREKAGYESVPIIAITAFAMEDDKIEFLSKGMDYYISKPFNRAELNSLLEDVFKQK